VRRKFLLAAAAGIGLLAAQSPQPDVHVAIFPPPAAYFDDVKRFLGLSDAQVEELREILAEKDRQAQELNAQIQTKQREISQMLESGAPDALRIGTLHIEIHELRKQTSGPDNSYRQRALAVLTPEQRAKLPALDQILKLSPAANQAVLLLLLEPLPPGPPVILSRPAAGAGFYSGAREP
jgi:hypothetical protein